MSEPVFRIDGKSVEQASDRIVRRYLTAGTNAVAETTKALERRLEAATQAAVPGRLWRAWKSDAYPKRGPAREPVGLVYLNGNHRTRGAMQFWTQPGEVRGKRGQYLAVPLPAAGPRGRARDLSPGEWERRHGIRLRFVYRPGRASLLVADQAVLSGRARVARSNSARRIEVGRGSATVPIFVLLPLVRHRNAVAIEPLIEAAGAEVAQNFIAEVAQLRD